MLDGLPDEIRFLPDGRLNLLLNDIRNLVSGNIVSVASDPLIQAAVNLLDNAIKHSSEKSPLHIEAKRVDHEIQICFRDQGVGIAKDYLSRLFERFYRVDKARSRKLGGTGLGLAIGKHIAQAHGGNITVESELERGSTFTLHLPV